MASEGVSCCQPHHMPCHAMHDTVDWMAVCQLSTEMNARTKCFKALAREQQLAPHVTQRVLGLHHSLAAGARSGGGPQRVTQSGATPATAAAEPTRTTPCARTAWDCWLWRCDAATQARCWPSLAPLWCLTCWTCRLHSWSWLRLLGCCKVQVVRHVCDRKPATGHCC